MTYPHYGYPGTQLAPMRNGLGTASLVLGIVAVALGWIPLIGLAGFICGIVGIALGIAGISRANRAVANNHAMAIVGTVLSVLGVIISVLVWMALASAISSTGAAAPRAAAQSADTAQSGDTAQSAGTAQYGGTQQTRFEAGQVADVDGMVITAGRLQKARSSFGSLVCSQVTYENRSGKTRSYNGLFDWKLQNPNGVIAMPSIFGVDDDLGAGDLAPGGHVTGRMCFEDPRLQGEYLIVNDELISFSDARVEWRTTL